MTIARLVLWIALTDKTVKEKAQKDEILEIHFTFIWYHRNISPSSIKLESQIINTMK